MTFGVHLQCGLNSFLDLNVDTIQCRRGLSIRWIGAAGGHCVTPVESTPTVAVDGGSFMTEQGNPSSVHSDGDRISSSTAQVESAVEPTDSQVGSIQGGDSPVAGTEDRVVAIHQPNYLPWIGYFGKIARSDVFVFLDDVEYSDRSWINRNRIKTPDGWTWLTVPVRGSSGAIEDVQIAGDDWRDHHRKSLQQNYGKATAFDEVRELFEATYDRSWESLASLNVHLIRSIADRIGLECTYVRSSEIGVDATKTERIVRLCEGLGADRYLSGTGARSYLARERFDRSSITLEYQSFTHPEYEQRFGEFIPKLSIVDVLANVGPQETAEIVHSLGDDE